MGVVVGWTAWLLVVGWWLSDRALDLWLNHEVLWLNHQPEGAKMSTTTGYAKSIGPRVVGGIYRCGYSRQAYRVISIQEQRDDWMGWSIVEVDIEGPQAGRVRTHCTSWDYKRDQIITQP